MRRNWQLWKFETPEDLRFAQQWGWIGYSFTIRGLNPARKLRFPKSLMPRIIQQNPSLDWVVSFLPFSKWTEIIFPPYFRRPSSNSSVLDIENVFWAGYFKKFQLFIVFSLYPLVANLSICEVELFFPFYPILLTLIRMHYKMQYCAFYMHQWCAGDFVATRWSWRCSRRAQEYSAYTGCLHGRSAVLSGLIGEAPIQPAPTRSKF